MKEDVYTQYIRQFISYDNELLRTLDADHRDRFDVQPFVEQETAKLVALLIRSQNMKKILELGTGLGYSAIWIGEAVKATDGGLTTVDNHPRTSKEARANILSAGLEGYVTCLEKDIEQYIPELAEQKVEQESYDLIFQDSGKYLYPLMYEDVYRLLKPGGLLITDDTAFPVEDVRNGLKRHVELYNTVLFSDSRYYSTLLPVGHGLAVSLKLGVQHDY